MDTEKLDLKSPDLVNENFEKLAALFPNCVTESAEGKAIDFDLLKQELNHNVVEGNKERYRLEWPGKREAIVTANLPTTKTLRPIRQDSVDFDNTENLYIEGDNLEVLKLLQESYLGKIKMIYIDPPYNTGKDFVYKDNFSKDTQEELFESGQKDEYNQRLVVNPETAGRYHSDWLSMMYPRLKLARNLLTNDGVIFVSIDDHEVSTLRRICDEIFGEMNFLASLIWDTNHSAQAGIFKVYHQYILVYAKNLNEVRTPNTLNSDLFEAGAMKRESKRHPMQKFKFPKGTRFEAPDDTELSGTWGEAEKVILHEGRMIAKDRMLVEDVVLEAAFTQANQMKHFFYGDKETLVDSRGQRVTEFYFISSGKIKIIKKRSVDTPQTTRKYSTQGAISKKLADLFELSTTPLDSPKPVDMVQEFAAWFMADDDIILDFFSGSATTAESLLTLNTQDNGNRSFILVQLPEKTDETSEAFKAGYKNICEIGKERIRRAAKAIIKEQNSKIDKEKEALEKSINGKLVMVDGQWIFPQNVIIEEKSESLLQEINNLQVNINNLDTGFRVYRLDSSNMQDVYYKPQDYKQERLELFEDNVKSDRSADDLLAQVMLDWGLPLSLKITPVDVLGKKVFKVAENSLYACFDKGVDEAFAKEIAKDKPLRIVFKDSSFKDDTAKINVKQLLKQLSPDTEMKVI